MSTTPTALPPPPPTPDEASAAVPNVPQTRGERIGSALGGRAEAFAAGLSGLSGAQPRKFEDTTVGKALQKNYDTRLAEARRNWMDAQTKLQVVDSGVDPQTGQPLTDQQRADLTNEAQGAWGAYAKAAGVDKETKAHIAQKGNLFNLALTHGIKAAHEIAKKLGVGGDEGGGGGQAAAGGAQGKGITPPPTPGPQPAAGAATAPASSAAAAGNPAVPPPPAPKVDAGVTRAEMGQRNKLAMDQAASDIEEKRQIAVEKAKSAGEIKTTDEQWLKSFKDEHGREPSASEVEAHQVGKTERPIDAEVLKGIKLAEDGDLEGAQKIFYAVQSGAGARKGPSASGQSLMATIQRANSGDPLAQKNLQTYMQMQKDLAKERGAGYGAGRAMYQIGSYVDPNTNQVIALSALDAIQRIRNGENLVPSGRLPAAMIAGAQRLVKESEPAIKEVRDNLKAYDNASDRAIFARVMTSAGKPAYGEESGWLGNVLNQAATDNLSPEGKKLVVRLARLNETIGTLRQTLGSPATDASMALMLGLLPGPSTPDSKMASDMIDQLEQNVTNAVEIPALTGVAKPKGVTPPPSPKGNDTPRFHRPSANVVVEQ